VTGSFKRRSTFFLAALTGLVAAPALSQDNAIGYAKPGEIGFQPSVTPIMDSVTAFHNGLLIWIITGIALFVLGLMIYVMVRFNRRANPTPQKFSHNTLVEVVWVVIPVIILLVIAAPSFAVLGDQLNVPDGQRKYLGSDIFSFGDVDVPAAELTVKATGVQWNWEYAYPDISTDSFSSFMLPEQDPDGKNQDRPHLKPNQPRLLAVDNELVVPVNTTVRVLVTSEPSGVIHSFAMPSFGIKIDAVPGRMNETWFNVRKTGIYYGQCSELCGKDHAFMPIAIRVVEKDQFQKWIDAYKTGGTDAANQTLPPVT